MYIHFWSSDYDIAFNASHVRSDRYLVHSHPYYELHYVIGGDVVILYDGREIQVQPHGLTLISPDVPHGLKVNSERSYERYTVHFTEDILSPAAKQILLSVFSPDFQPRRDNHLKNMGMTNVLHYCQDLVSTEHLPTEIRDRVVPLMIEALLSSIYLTICNMDYLPDTQFEPYNGVEIVGYVNAHYKERLSLGQLAEKFFCSKSYLNNLFKKKTGTTVMTYIQQLRLTYAQVLLDNGYSAIRASDLAGFSEYSSFFRAYVKMFGKAPSNDKSRPILRTVEPGHTQPIVSDDDSGAHTRKFRTSIWDLYPVVDDLDGDPSLLRD